MKGKNDGLPPIDMDLVKRYEQMIKSGSVLYFDVEEVDEIVEYYIRENQLYQALDCVEFAEKQHPHSWGLQLRKSQLWAATGKNQQAYDLIKEIEKLEPNSYEVYLTKGTILSQMNRTGEALVHYNKAVALAGDDADEVLIYIAYEYENIGRYDMAIDCLKKSIKLNPSNETSIYELAFCYDVTQQYQQGVNYFTKMVDDEPYSVAGWYNLGLFYSKLEQYPLAIDAYDYALAINEEFSSAYFNKANAYANLERYTEAIEIYKETFKYEEPDPTAFLYIAECYENLNDNDKALRYFHKATKANPNLADAWCGMGVVLDNMNKPTEAIYHMQKAIAIDENNPEYWYILGDIYMKTGLTEEGETAYANVIELDPANEDIWPDFVGALYQNEKVDEAIETAALGIKVQPQNWSLVYVLAALQFEAGYEKEAINLFEEALANDYDKYTITFDVVPSLQNNAIITEMIDLYKNHKDA